MYCWGSLAKLLEIFKNILALVVVALTLYMYISLFLTGSVTGQPVPISIILLFVIIKKDWLIKANYIAFLSNDLTKCK